MKKQNNHVRIPDSDFYRKNRDSEYIYKDENSSCSDDTKP